LLELSQGKGNAKDLAEKHSLEHLARAFRLKSKGGIGLDLEVEATKNGIECKIIMLVKKDLAPEELAKESAALIKMAQIIHAVGEIYAHVPHRNDKGKNVWDKYNKDMIQGSQRLIEAIKSGNAKAVRTAAGKLNQSCCECHAIIRLP